MNRCPTNLARPFLRTLITTAFGICAAGAILPAQPAFAQNTFSVGTSTCGGCSICLLFNEAGPGPVHQSGACSNLTGCGASPSRSADLTSDRGQMLVACASSDGSSCPQNLFASAKWNPNGSATGSDIFFTGPQGQTTVTTRVRYVISNTAGGDASLRLTANLGGGSVGSWAVDMLLPLNVSGFVVTSPLKTVVLNAWNVHSVEFYAVAINGSASCVLHFPIGEDVFELPEGYTANSAALNIVNNRWLGVCTPPSIATHPADQTLCPSAPAGFTVAAAGTAALNYQWRRDGSNLSDGGEYSGTSTATLTISAAALAAGDYDCVVSNACGSATSDAATLTVCHADYNCDGFMDGLDYDLFNNDFENPDPAQQIHADYNGDGFVDGIDYDSFYNDFGAGC